jgi:hypothetical protein
MCDFGQIWLLPPALCMNRGKRRRGCRKGKFRKPGKSYNKIGKKNSRIAYVSKVKTVVKFLLCFVQ